MDSSSCLRVRFCGEFIRLFLRGKQDAVDSLPLLLARAVSAFVSAENYNTVFARDARCS